MRRKHCASLSAIITLITINENYIPSGITASATTSNYSLMTINERVKKQLTRYQVEISESLEKKTSFQSAQFESATNFARDFIASLLLRASATSIVDATILLTGKFFMPPGIGKFRHA